MFHPALGLFHASSRLESQGHSKFLDGDASQRCYLVLKESTRIAARQFPPPSLQETRSTWRRSRTKPALRPLPSPPITPPHPLLSLLAFFSQVTDCACSSQPHSIVPSFDRPHTTCWQVGGPAFLWIHLPTYINNSLPQSLSLLSIDFLRPLLAFLNATLR